VSEVTDNNFSEQQVAAQRVRLTTATEEVFEFLYLKHPKYFKYVLRLEPQEGLLEELFPALRATWETTFDPDCYTIYVEEGQRLAVGSQLYLRAVPRGLGFASKESLSHRGALKSVEIF